MAVKEKPRVEIEREYGVPGVENIAGEITNIDYNADITLATYNEMLKSDGQVKAVEQVITLPLKQAEWFIEPASDDPRDIEIADFVEKNWEPLKRDFLEQVFDYLFYGSFLFEVVYEERAGGVYFKKLAPRLPETIIKWHENKEGDLEKVTQFAMKEGQYQEIEIPARALLRFTHRQRGNNFKGESILRSAYKHWHIKNVLYKIDAVRFDRWGVGIPEAIWHEGVSETDKAEIDKFLRELRANERSYIRHPDTLEVKILTPTGQGGAMGIQEAIEHHDMQIARSVLASFLNFSTSRFGSRAALQGLQEFFLASLKGVAEYVAAILGGQVKRRTESGGIRDLVDMNFEGVERYPYVVPGRLQVMDLVGQLTVIPQLVHSGALAPDQPLQEYIRAQLGVPIDVTDVRGGNGKLKPKVEAADAATLRFIREVGAIQSEQRRQLVESLERGGYKALREIPLQGALTNTIEDILFEAYPEEDSEKLILLAENMAAKLSVDLRERLLLGDGDISEEELRREVLGLFEAVA